jgi:TolB-like protein
MNNSRPTECCAQHAPFLDHSAVTASFDHHIDSVKSEEVRSATAHILSSPFFQKARRMSRLLSFLVDKYLDGAVRDTGEYTVGIEVFDRDPATYATGEDPIVRVQVGRLRARLLNYYATVGADVPLRITIPYGSYMPEIRHFAKAFAPSDRLTLQVAPLVCRNPEPAHAAFAFSFDEELAFRLFKEFGTAVVTGAGPGVAMAGTGVSYCLEGSMRGGGDMIRIALRLVEPGGRIVWFEQFDRPAPCSLAHQEELAMAVCAALRPCLHPRSL